jgi:hypothetical protein
VASAAEQRELSDGLGVSSALYLGASDMLKLRAMLEEPDTPAQVLRVLRRLSMAPLTIHLNNSTEMLEFMVSLSTDDTVQAAVLAGVEEAAEVATLAARVVSVWEAQLVDERKQREASARHAGRQKADAESGKAKKKPKDPSCRACQGQHRAHTCIRDVNVVR